MQRELQDYYDARWDLFATRGWRDLIDELGDFEKVVNSLDSAKTLEELHFRKGQLDMIRFFLHLEAVSRATYDKLQEEESNVESVE